MWLLRQTFYSGHDLLPSAITGEVQGTLEAPLYSLHRLGQGLWPGWLGWALQHPPDDWMPLEASQHDNIFSSQYEGNHSVQEQNVQTI